MPDVLAQHPRFFDDEGLRTACARLRQNGEVDPVQIRADAQTLMREMEACLYWAEGMALRERLAGERSQHRKILLANGEIEMEPDHV